MGTLNATLLFTVPRVTSVTGTLLPNPVPRQTLRAFFASRFEFSTSRGVLTVDGPDQVGVDEVNQ